MFEALIQREIDVTENALTSSVLGSLAWLDGPSALVELVNSARPFRDTTKLRLSPDATARLYLWPRTKGCGVPDALVIVTEPTGTVTHVAIEAKLGAGKSSRVGAGDVDDADPVGPSDRDDNERDQLAKYWRAIKNGLVTRPGGLPPPKNCAVIYLTHHVTMPIKALQESAAANSEAKLYWASWREVLPIVDRRSNDAGTSGHVARDLARCLVHLGFVCFRGFARATALSGSSSAWTFFAGPRARRPFTMVSIRSPLPSALRWRFSTREAS